MIMEHRKKMTSSDYTLRNATDIVDFVPGDGIIYNIFTGHQYVLKSTFFSL